MKIEEKSIYFKNEEELPCLPLLGIGGHGTVYFTPDTAYKYFAFDLDDSERDLNRYQYFQSLKLADFSFPVKLIFVGNCFYGYTMPLFKGHDLEQFPFNDSFSTLKKIMTKAEKSMMPLSDYKIKVDDLAASNVILLDRLKFIDIDLYSYDNSFSRQECLDNNLMFLDSLCGDIIYSSLSKGNLKAGQLIDSWTHHLDFGSASYLEFIDTVQKKLSEIAGEEVKTFKQGAKILKKI